MRLVLIRYKISDFFSSLLDSLRLIHGDE